MPFLTVPKKMKYLGFKCVQLSLCLKSLNAQELTQRKPK